MTEFDKKTLHVTITAAFFATAFCVVFVNFFGFFGFFVAIPIFFTLFTYGVRAALLCAFLASFSLLLFFPPVSAALLGFFFFFPALLLGFAAYPFGSYPFHGNSASSHEPLNNPFDETEEPSVFPPLSQLMFLAALTASFVTFCLIIFLLSFPDILEELYQFFELSLNLLGQDHLSIAPFDSVVSLDQFKTMIRKNFIVLIASLIAICAFIFLLGSFFLSLYLTKKYGTLPRSKDDWRVTLRMPPAALFLFVICWSLNQFFVSDFTSDFTSHLTSNLTWTLCLAILLAPLTIGFLLSGIAVLHQTRMVWLLIILYIGLFTMILAPFIAIALILLGLFYTPFSSHKTKKKPPHHTHFLF